MSTRNALSFSLLRSLLRQSRKLEKSHKCVYLSAQFPKPLWQIGIGQAKLSVGCQKELETLLPTVGKDIKTKVSIHSSLSLSLSLFFRSSPIHVFTQLCNVLYMYVYLVVLL